MSAAAAAFGAPGAAPARRGRTNPITWTIEHPRGRAGRSCAACSGPTASRSRRRPASCSASSLLVAVFLGVADFVAGKLINAIL